MNDSKLQDLTAAYADGALDDRGERWLADALDAASIADRSDAARDVLIDRLLRQTASPAVDPEVVLRGLPAGDGSGLRGSVLRRIERLPARRRASRWPVPVTAALLVAATAFILYRAGQDRETRLRDAYILRVDGKPLERGGTVAASARPVQLDLGGYCRVELAADTSVRLEGGRGAEQIRLDRGRVACEVDRSKGSFAVRSAAGTATVVGTRFEAWIEAGDAGGADRLGVEVSEGSVLLADAAGERQVRAGETAVSTPADVHVVRPEDFGAAGDGKRDDAAAMALAVAALRAREGPKVLRLGARKRYRLAGGDGAIYPLDLPGDTRVQGNGATLLIAVPEKRAIRIRKAGRVVVQGLVVDYDPLPFTQGEVTAVDPEAGTVDVRIAPGFDLPPDFADPPANPPFFGKVYRKGGLFAHHYIQSMRVVDAARRLVRLQSQPQDVRKVADVAVGRPMVIPIPGRGQREGGPVLEIRESGDVTLDDVSIHAAPLFASVVRQNRGPIHFRRVSVRPPPGSTRIISSWRDAFHVKDNRAAVTFERCHVERPQDDAFNVSAHWLPVRILESPTRLTVGRPHGAPLPEAGDTLQAYDPATGAILGTTQVVAVSGQGTVDVKKAVPGLAAGRAVIALEACNPDSWIRDCTIIGTGLRLRSPLRFEGNTVDGGTVLVSAYDVEGPVPQGLVFRNNDFKHVFAPILMKMEITGPGPAARSIRDVTFVDNAFHRAVSLGDAEDVRFEDNDFRTIRGKTWVWCVNMRRFLVTGLKGDGGAVRDPLQHIAIGQGMTAEDVLQDER